MELRSEKAAPYAKDETGARFLTILDMPQEAINILSKSKPSDRVLVRRNMDGLIKPRPINMDVKL